MACEWAIDLLSKRDHLQVDVYHLKVPGLKLGELALFRITYDQHKYYAFFCVTVLVLPWVIRISNGLFSAATLDNRNAGYAVSQAHL